MCEKLNSVGDERRTLNEFLEWLETEQGIALCNREQTDSGFAKHGYYEPIRKKHEELVFEFLEIDPKKLEDERRAMVEDLQEKVG